jgi:hypothetical protein
MRNIDSARSKRVLATSWEQAAFFPATSFSYPAAVLYDQLPAVAEASEVIARDPEMVPSRGWMVRG